MICNDWMPLLTQARCDEAGGYDTPGSFAMAGVEISAENCLFLKIGDKGGKLTWQMKKSVFV
ncbi:hypothetical protein [Exiguobacterium mexicanum]|uniref:hypothetical protein n=1 Tax=Exiguobacterium mexicanum TaxID=340146 RepID=UPI0037BFAEA0